MIPHRVADDFLQLVQRGIRSAHELLAFLKQENTALTADDLDTFLELAQQKKEKIAALEAIDRQRAALLQTAGLADDEQGSAAFLSQCSTQAASLPQQWDEFLTTLKACQQQNETNGRMIHARQHQLQEALAILRGQFGEDGLAYDQQGKPTKATSTSSIAKA